MPTSSFGTSCTTGSSALAPPQTRAAVSYQQLVADKHGAIVRAWRRKDRARTDAEYQDADATIARLGNELADLHAAQAKGRVPSVEA